MPSVSQSQRGLIFSKRNRYGSENNTPKKWKWVWEEGWENKGKLPKYKKKNKKKKNENIIIPFSSFTHVNEGIWGGSIDSLGRRMLSFGKNKYELAKKVLDEFKIAYSQEENNGIGYLVFNDQEEYKYAIEILSDNYTMWNLSEKLMKEGYTINPKPMICLDCGHKFNEFEKGGPRFARVKNKCPKCKSKNIKV